MACEQPGTRAGISSPATGPDSATSATLTGTRMSTVQQSRAELVRLTSARAAGSAAFSAGPASTGTMIEVSAPPSTMS